MTLITEKITRWEVDKLQGRRIHQLAPEINFNIYKINERSAVSIEWVYRDTGKIDYAIKVSYLLNMVSLDEEIDLIIKDSLKRSEAQFEKRMPGLPLKKIFGYIKERRLQNIRDSIRQKLL